MALLGPGGSVPADSPQDVRRKVAAAEAAAAEWRASSFARRRLFLKTMHKFILANQRDICRVSSRDSGKTQLEAVMGEIIVTCEKLRWLCTAEAEGALRPERRSAGRMAFYKRAQVEFVPYGVIAAIVPWNWPFHNLINPVSAATFAGNAIVVKVSEHSAWSARLYASIVRAALRASGAPEDLVQIVVGHGDAGQALVTDPGVGKVVFVGSTEVGRRVMAAAAARLTPVTLELGGKDAFVVGPGADLSSVVPVAIKAAFLNCGQNCASGERFLVHESLYEEFCERAASCARAMRQGPGAAGAPERVVVDSGAMCMPGAVEKVQRLVDDAVKKGAKVLSGGKPGCANAPLWVSGGEKAAENGGGGAGEAPTPSPGRATRSSRGKPAAADASSDSSPSTGQFYPPTVLTGVTRDMLIWREEVFGPVMMVVSWQNEDEAVALANDCEFGLGSSVFAGSEAQARRIASRLEAGMSSVNDFNATYMCQSLPFGGVKQSGFGRFGGVEGLRALTVAKAVAFDRCPLLMRTTIPAPWLHPVGSNAAPFARGLTTMFYGQSLGVRAQGLREVLLALATLAMGEGARGGGSAAAGAASAARSAPSKRKSA
jgi:acyl-CoA reductase-like NAD-dependent aldehyde dehydrogenase